MRRRTIATIVIGAASLAAWGAVGSSVAAASETGIAERVEKLEKRVSALEATLAGVTRSGNTLRFSGMNVKVDNGSSEAFENGLGNLVVGEERCSGCNPEGGVTGSNNLVVGDANTVAGWGNLVAGVFNHAAAPGIGYDFVTGISNRATGPLTAILGGGGSEASGEFSTVSGGTQNHATGEASSVSGGNQNTASGYGSSVFGGLGNNASGRCSTAPLSAGQSC